VFAPREARAGDAVLLQVFAHLPTRARSARRLAQEFDATAERRGFTPLGTEVPRGATLAFELVMRELRVHDTRQELVWHGRADSVQFDVEVPADARVGNHNGTIYVAQDGNPIGHVTFQLKVLAQSAAADSTRVPTGTGKRYQRAFISYAREDLDEVLKRVQGLTAVGVTYRQDVFDLLPGDPWWATIVGYIDESDVFVLFWSTAAKRSRWVKREWTYALERPSEDFIRPWLIEGPPIPAPPSQLQHLHFDDKSLHYR
jgi:hypothetical protein